MRYSSLEVDALVVKAVDHDREAMESLLLHFYDPLLVCVRSWLSRAGETTPEDLVQITMAEAFQRIWILEPRGGEAFFTWLKTIARTRLVNLIESQRTQKRGEGVRPVVRITDADGEEKSILRLLAGPGRTPSMIARRNEASNAMRQALAQLDPGRRQLVAWRYGQGLSYQEIAAKEGKSVPAIKMSIHRILQELRDFISGDLGEFSIGE